MKERESNFEILRIISMCGIVSIHYLADNMSGMIIDSTFPEFAWIFKQIILSAAYPLVNCFVLISGYFLVKKSSFEIRKVMDLLIITAFYGMAGYLIGLYFGIADFTVKEVIYAIIPFFNSRRWFVETYIILILFAPFINKAINQINKERFEILLFIQLFLFCLWYSIGLSAPLLDDGYGIINFITLYLLGAYFRLFGCKTKIYKLRKFTLLSGYLLSVGITFLLSYFINPFGYAFVTNICGSVLLFILFSKWNCGRNKRVNKLSASVFDVYFVHSDRYTCRLLIFDILKGKLVVGSTLMLPHLIITIFSAYIIGIVAYFFRKKFFLITIDKVLDKNKLLNTTIDI